MSDTPEPPPPDLPPLPAAAATLADQLVELSALTGGLAHEIRNPLSTLKVNLQLLDEDWRQVESADSRRPCDPQEVARRSRRRIAALIAEADHLECILQDFLGFVAGRELRRTPVDLNELITDLADFFRPQAEAHRLDFRTYPAAAPLICHIDEGLVKQALLNLLLNAQQAMPNGGSLLLHAAPLGETEARLDVIDNGPGIPEDQQARIFEAYYSTRKSGTGLGLATARKIIRQHGGDLTVSSVPGQGSCFTIRLPRDEATKEAT